MLGATWPALYAKSRMCWRVHYYRLVNGAGTGRARAQRGIHHQYRYPVCHPRLPFQSDVGSRRRTALSFPGDRRRDTHPCSVDRLSSAKGAGGSGYSCHMLALLLPSSRCDFGNEVQRCLRVRRSLSEKAQPHYAHCTRNNYLPPRKRVGRNWIVRLPHGSESASDWTNCHCSMRVFRTAPRLWRGQCSSPVPS